MTFQIDLEAAKLMNFEILSTCIPRANFSISLRASKSSTSALCSNTALGCTVCVVNISIPASKELQVLSALQRQVSGQPASPWMGVRLTQFEKSVSVHIILQTL